MKKLSNILFTEFNNLYHNYLFVQANRKKLLKFILLGLMCFGFWLWGYKWRDAKIIWQNIQISQLSKKKEDLKRNIQELELNLEEYNFMLEDGDYYRYLAFKHGDVLVPEETNAEDLKLLTEQSKKYNIPFKYIYRLVWKESRYNPEAQSSAGAKGYMQVMPATFNNMKEMYEDTASIDIDDYNKRQQNILVGTYTLNYLYNKYKNWKLVFAAYNAGSGNVDKANGVPNIPETQAYVKYIMNK